MNTRTLRWFVLGGLLIARIALSVDMIGRPGLQYDETLFVNAATLRIPGWFITHSIAGIPVMVFPYIGALKSWLYAPLFSIFGNSATVIRLPVVLITSGGLVLVYLAIRDLVNRPVAILAFAALCFDGSVFWLTRDDVGPSSIEFFLKCAALWCAARFARGRSERWVWLLLATLALGVLNKLNFIWVVNAVAVVSVVVMIRHRDELRSNTRTITIWVGGLAVIYAAFGAYYFGDHIGNLVLGPGVPTGLVQPWSDFEIGMRGILSGTWYYSYALAPLGPRDVVVAVVLALFAWGTFASLVPRLERNFAIAGLSLATLLIGVQVLFTAQATAGWHYIAVYPSITIVAAYGVYAGAHALLRHRSAVLATVACAGALALTYEGVLLGKYMTQIGAKREPANVAWSPAIYALSDYVRHANAEALTVDWGLANPLFALHPSHRIDEISFALESPTHNFLKAFGKYLLSIPGPKLVITHPTRLLVFPHANANLFAAVRGHLRLVKVIDGPGSGPVYLVYALR